MKSITLMLVTVVLVAGCGDSDPRFASDQIAITLSLKENNIVGTTVEERKNVSTEVSNPYANFLKIVEEEFGEKPVEIKVESVSVRPEPIMSKA